MFKFPNYNIILPKYLEIVKKKGSSLALPANGLGGSRATSLLVAHFALQNTASNSAKKKNRPREGVAACLRKTMAGKKGGGGGDLARHYEFKKSVRIFLNAHRLPLNFFCSIFR